MSQPLLGVGDLVAIAERELRGAPARPGLVVPIERGAYGFEIVILCAVEDAAGEQLYRGQVRGVWGQVPCA